MIDVLIIIGYVLVVLKIFLSAFTWFEEFFNINGKATKVTKQIS